MKPPRRMHACAFECRCRQREESRASAFLAILAHSSTPALPGRPVHRPVAVGGPDLRQSLPSGRVSRCAISS